MMSNDISSQKILSVEGWRYKLHSYSIVCRNHCLSILNKKNINLRFNEDYSNQASLRAHNQDVYETHKNSLGALKRLEEGETPDAVLRMAHPLCFSPPYRHKTFLFGSSEFCIQDPADFGGSFSANIMENEPLLSIMTPSRWSAVGFERLGIPKERITIIPHGFDPTVFRPDDNQRRVNRYNIGIKEDEIVFFSMGNFRAVKGLNFLLPAFAKLAASNSKVRLILKGQDRLYGSKELVLKQLANLPNAESKLIQERLIYYGQDMTDQYLATLYRVADVYVAPYIGEGFAMPVLEAAASGLPIICTKGGPTDDFTRPSYALRIDSTLHRIDKGLILWPNLDHLIELMSRAAQDQAWRVQAGKLAYQDAHQSLTWDKVTDLLLQKLFG